MFGRPQKPKSLVEASRRWDSLASQSRREVDLGGARPSALLSMGIAALCLLMIGAVVMLYKSGSLAPVKAEAASAKAPANEALTAVLDSARKLMAQAEWIKSEAVLRRAAQQFPEQQDIRLALAETLLAMNKPADSYEQYEKALAIGPREPKIEFAAGQVASKAGLLDRAEEHFGAAQAADPTDASAPLMLGMIQRKQGNVQSAKASLLRAANIDPDNAYAWGALADIALSENHLDLAAQHIERARRRQPESREWRLVDARILKRKGEPELALRLLTPMDASQKHEPTVARLIAECFGLLNRHNEAASALATAFDANTTNAEMAYEAAAAFERAGQRQRAIEYATQAKILGNKPAAAMLTKMGL